MEELKNKLKDINDTIDQICEACSNAYDISDASYTANSIEVWLDQLKREIEEYNDMERGII